jgi:hypothetical protein
MAIEAAFDARKSVSFAEYERIENLRESYIENPDFTADSRSRQLVRQALQRFRQTGLKASKTFIEI